MFDQTVMLEIMSPVADRKGVPAMGPPNPKSFIFMQFSAENYKIIRWRIRHWSNMGLVPRRCESGRMKSLN